MFQTARRHINTTSDSEILLNIFANELDKNESLTLSEEDVFRTMTAVHRQVRGSYAVVAMILGHGMVAFRDPWGIRPLALGKRDTEDGEEYIVASESVAIDGTGFKYMRDVEPGEAIYITNDGKLYSRQCADKPIHCPCIFSTCTLRVPTRLLMAFRSMPLGLIWAVSWASR